MRYVYFLFLTACLAWAQPEMPQPEPLSGALWKGEITLSVKGELVNQYLANEMSEKNVPIGFNREKAHADLDIQFKVAFLINSLGEFHAVGTTLIRGQVDFDQNHTYQIEEEVLLDGGLKAPVEIKASELSQSSIKVEEATGTLPLGKEELLVEAEGRMNKRGTFRIKGSLSFPFQGEGAYERRYIFQPTTETKRNYKKEGVRTINFIIPVNFSLEMDHRKKPLSGDFTGDCPLKNPFEDLREGEAEREGSLFKNLLQVKGHYSLTPLFGQ